MKKIYCTCGSELKIINEDENLIVVSPCTCQTFKNVKSCPYGHDIKYDFSTCQDRHRCPKNAWMICCQGTWNQ